MEEHVRWCCSLFPIDYAVGAVDEINTDNLESLV
jgi:hypothetical protein